MPSCDSKSTFTADQLHKSLKAESEESCTMPGPPAVPIDVALANGTHANDVNGRGHVPRTPSLSGLSLTEYSANPSPPSEDKRARMRQIVPDEFLLPNGHPDVSAILLCIDKQKRLLTTQLELFLAS